jgi:hypothetical protein
LGKGKNNKKYSAIVRLYFPPLLCCTASTWIKREAGPWVPCGCICIPLLFHMTLECRFFSPGTGGRLSSKMLFYGSVMFKCVKCFKVETEKVNAQERMTKLNAIIDSPC